MALLQISVSYTGSVTPKAPALHPPPEISSWLTCPPQKRPLRRALTKCSRTPGCLTLRHNRCRVHHEAVLTSSGTSAWRSTGTNPGATVFTVIPNRASSRAQPQVRPICALLAVAWADWPGGGRCATSESMCTIRYRGHQESGPGILTRVRWGEGGGESLGRGVRLWSSEIRRRPLCPGKLIQQMTSPTPKETRRFSV